MITTILFILVPKLITDVIVDSPSASGITLIVVVNNVCAGSENLSINATVKATTGEVVSQQQTSFINTSLSLGPLPPAEYNCFIFIMNGTQILDRMNISCGINIGTYVVVVAFITFIYIL